MSAPNPSNHVELAISWGLPRFSSAFWAQRFLGAIGSVPCDLLAEATRLAARAGMLYDTQPAPPDASHEQPHLSLELQGAGAMLPLATEDDTAGTPPLHALHTRLREKWDHYLAPARTQLINETTRAGYLSTVAVPGDPAAPIDSHGDFWARFWVDTGPGAHPLSGGATCGALVCGTDRLGPFPNESAVRWYRELRAIVERARPAQWVVWDYRFDMGATTIRLMGQPGSAHRYLDSDYIYES